MFYDLIKKTSDNWLQSEECKIKGIIEYIEKNWKLRDAQIESIKLYLFFKLHCWNKSLEYLFNNWYFLQNIDLDNLKISKKFYEFLSDQNNISARQLFEIAYLYENSWDGSKKETYWKLRQAIEDNFESIDFKKVFKDIFHDTSYANYIYSLPMWAGKTFLMSAFIYLDLYFSLNEPNNKIFAHNFIVLAPSGLKSSIIPSLRKIREFDTTWIFAEPTATNLKNSLKFEILDEQKTDKKSNKIKNPNVGKIAQYQPYEDMMWVVFLTNAEKVILDHYDKDNPDNRLIYQNSDTKELETIKAANELRDTIAKIPNLAIFIDEVHHVADEEIKLHQVVEWRCRTWNINEVIWFSWTPYLDSPEEYKITDELSIINSDIPSTIYYYPLINAIWNFLKTPTVLASNDNNPLNIIKSWLEKFFEIYMDVEYEKEIWNLTSKVAIYCSSIKKLEDEVYPLVCKVVTDLWMNPNDVVLKYHGWNKEYTLPEENTREFDSLDTPLSTKRVILLVWIWKEWRDCTSLTSVILSQKNDCPQKMVLQTSCRCLRQINKSNKETALIYLNNENKKLLVNQLKESQHATLEEFQNWAKDSNSISRVSRMAHLDIPDVNYYKLNIKYEDEVSQEADPEKSIQSILEKINDDSSEFRENVIVEEISITWETIQVGINDIIYWDSLSYNEWLLSIVKESFNFITMNALKTYESLLKQIYNKITKEWKINEAFNIPLINKSIRLWFYNTNTLKVEKEEIPESTSILNITYLWSKDVQDNDAIYPESSIVNKILLADNGQDIEKKYSDEEILKLSKENPGLLAEYFKKQDGNVPLEIKNKDKTFHYIPYLFLQSKFEKEVLKNILTLQSFEEKKLEVYYNWDHDISSFKIECYKIEKNKVKKVWKYTPDFLIIQRDDENTIHKMLILETKGKWFWSQQEFKDRMDYVENTFIKDNNEKFWYQKFDYLYIEDSLSEDDRINKINTAINNLFTDNNEKNN